MKVLIVSPVRDEEACIERTITCMLRQTVLPDMWIIVNDGSRDGTGRIVKSYADICPFIRYVELPDRGRRLPGQGVVEAFYAGLDGTDYREFDVISKFDGDLEFDDDMLENIIAEFERDPRLGITGGIRFERKTADGPFSRVIVSREFVGGPYKFYRRQCFDDIGGLVRRAGWDGIDDIRANIRGWKTGECEHIVFLHLKPTGSAKGEGLVRANAKYGDIAYYMGGYFWYFLLRVITRSWEIRSLTAARAMVKGYFSAMIAGTDRESPEFRRHLKKIQIENVFYRVRLLFKKTDRTKVLNTQP